MGVNAVHVERRHQFMSHELRRRDRLVIKNVEGQFDDPFSIGLREVCKTTPARTRWRGIPKK